MQDGVLVNSLRQSLQQSFANSRNTRYNAGSFFSQFIKTKLTIIIYQEQKYEIQCSMASQSNHEHKAYNNHMPTTEILDKMQDGVSFNSLRQSLQQSFANSRNTRHNAG